MNCIYLLCDHPHLGNLGESEVVGWSADEAAARLEAKRRNEARQAELLQAGHRMKPLAEGEERWFFVSAVAHLPPFDK